MYRHAVKHIKNEMIILDEVYIFGGKEYSIDYELHGRMNVQSE